jgi:hypothetical protein
VTGVFLNRPCADCPFLKEGAIHLEKGRVEGIIGNLMDDHNTFHCHKTVHSRLGGEWDEAGHYQSSGNESPCMGAIAYMWRAHGQVSILTRLGMMERRLTRQQIELSLPLVIEPLPTPKRDRYSRF